MAKLMFAWMQPVSPWSTSLTLWFKFPLGIRRDPQRQTPFSLLLIESVHNQSVECLGQKLSDCGLPQGKSVAPRDTSSPTSFTPHSYEV